MSRYRDPHKAKLRRDRIRRQKQAERFAARPGSELPPAFDNPHPFASERSLRQIRALIEDEKFGSIDEANARLKELTASGRMEEMANAWKQDDPKWRAQELAYDALETDDLETALRLADQALKLDPDCTDAQRLMVSLLPATPENKLHLMREVVEKAERNLGEDFLRETAGHFWGDVFTRPYMRAKQRLAELLVETGKLDEAIEVYERMLELNPNDNQGMRFGLLGLYLAAGQPEGARRLISRYPKEEEFSAMFAWGRVMERWLVGELDQAGQALARARKVNRFAERYFWGARELPRKSPEYFQPGQESEAQVCARELAMALESQPGFRAWLGERGKANTGGGE
jgi:tetratricopeptide (TPR) repeat protein